MKKWSRYLRVGGVETGGDGQRGTAGGWGRGRRVPSDVGERLGRDAGDARVPALGLEQPPKVLGGGHDDEDSRAPASNERGAVCADPARAQHPSSRDVSLARIARRSARAILAVVGRRCHLMANDGRALRGDG